MELWLLGAGALVLVGITLWIVWPARSADSVGSKEVVEKPMTETVTSGLAPQGDRFEDQYTSATADLSAGGVAAAVQGLQETPTTPPPFPAGTYGAAPFNPTATAAPYPQPETSSSLIPRRSVGLGAGAVLALGGGVGGAWLYARWQRERNKPINRLRRSARDVASRLGERIPDVDELPRGAAPMSGAATALLLTALVASRALHRDSGDATTQEVRDRATVLLRDSVEEAMGRGRDAVKRGRQLQSRLPADRVPSADEARKPAVMGIGLGGMAVIAGATYMVWRLLRRGQPDRSTWYAGE
jgi:hypothetical protein